MSGKQWSAGTAFIAVSQLSAKHVECLTDASTLLATHTMSLEAVNNCERCGGGCRAPLAESCYVCDLLMQLDTAGQMSVAHGLSQEAMMRGEVKELAKLLSQSDLHQVRSMKRRQ